MVNKIKNIIIVGLVLTSFFAAFQSVFSLNYTFAREDSNGNSVDPSDLKSKSDSNSNSDSEKSKDTSPADAKTAILPSDWKIEDILNMVLVVVTTGVGIAAVGSIVFAGVLYITARDNAAQVSKAKTMIMNTIIGIVAYILMWAFLEWIIPGGIL